MKQNNKKISKRGKIALFEVINLVLAMFAFSFMIWESRGVDGIPFVSSGIKSNSGTEFLTPVAQSSGSGGGLLTAGTYTSRSASTAQSLATAYSKATGADPSSLLQAGETWTRSSVTATTEGSWTGTLTSNLGREYPMSGTAATQASVFGQSSGGSSWLSSALKPNILTGGWADALISGAQWAGLAFGAGYALGSLFGMEEGNKIKI